MIRGKSQIRSRIAFFQDKRESGFSRICVRGMDLVNPDISRAGSDMSAGCYRNFCLRAPQILAAARWRSRQWKEQARQSVSGQMWCFDLTECWYETVELNVDRRNSLVAMVAQYLPK